MTDDIQHLVWLLSAPVCTDVSHSVSRGLTVLMSNIYIFTFTAYRLAFQSQRLWVHLLEEKAIALESYVQQVMCSKSYRAGNMSMVISWILELPYTFVNPSNFHYCSFFSIVIKI